MYPVVQGQDRAARLQQLQQLRVDQAAHLPGLEEENRRLRRLLAETAQKKEELARRNLHIRREVQVLGAQFFSTCTEVERLKEAAPSGGGGQEERLKEVIGGVSKMRLDYVREVEVMNVERVRLEEVADGEVGTLTEVKRKVLKQITRLNQELEEKKNQKQEYELHLQAVKDEVERKKVERREVSAELEEAEENVLKKTQIEKIQEANLTQLKTITAESKKDLEAELAESRNERDTKRNEVEEVQITKEELNNLNFNKAEELTLVTASNKEIEASNNSKAINITKKMEQLSLEQDEAEDLATKTTQMKEQLDVVEKKISLAESEIVALGGVEEQEAELVGVNKKLSENIERLEQEAESKVQGLQRVKEDLAKVNEGIEKLLQNSKSIVELVEKQRRELQTLRSSLQESQRMIQEKEETAGSLEAKLENLVKEAGEKKVKIEESVELKAVVAAQLVFLDTENNLTAEKLDEAKKVSDLSEAEIYQVKADMKKSADHLQVIKSTASKIVENLQKVQQKVGEMQIKEELLAKEHDEVIAMSEDFANKLIVKEEALQEVAVRTKVLETDLETLKMELLEKKEVLAALEGGVEGAGTVEAREVEARLEELVSEVEKINAELEEKEKAEEEQMDAIEQAEKETKSLKNQLTEKNKLVKETTSMSKNVKQLVDQNKNKFDMKLKEQEETRKKLEQLVVNVSKFEELQKSLTQDLTKVIQDNQNNSDKESVTSEAFSKDLNKIAQQHAVKAKEVAEKRKVLEERVAVVRRQIQVEEIEMKNMAAKIKDPTKTAFGTSKKEDMMAKKKLLEEKSRKLQKLEQQLKQVSTTSMAPAISGATGAKTSMRSLPTPVRRVFLSTGSNHKAASGAYTLANRKEAEKVGTKTRTDGDVWALDSSSDSENGSGRPAKFRALSRSPFATPRQPLRLAADLVTPRTMTPQLQDSRARARLSLQRGPGGEGQVETRQTEAVTAAQVRHHFKELLLLQSASSSIKCQVDNLQTYSNSLLN